MTIVKEEKKANAITHAGTFHADEVMATAMLRQCMPELNLMRANKVPDDFEGLVYDIGFGKYDHHQDGRNGKRDNGIYYSSAGLIWRDFGEKILALYKIHDIQKAIARIDSQLVEPIDANDNGIAYDGTVPVYGFSEMIASMNPQWDETAADLDACFEEAVEIAEKVLVRALKREESRQLAEDGMEKALSKSKDGILLLSEHLPWKDYLEGNPQKDSIYYVIGPSNREGFNVIAVPPDGKPFEQRKPIPAEWRGKSVEEYKKLGLDGVIFVHAAGFIAAVDSLEHAIDFAGKCMEHL